MISHSTSQISYQILPVMANHKTFLQVEQNNYLLCEQCAMNENETFHFLRVHTYKHSNIHSFKYVHHILQYT